MIAMLLLFVVPGPVLILLGILTLAHAIAWSASYGVLMLLFGGMACYGSFWAFRRVVFARGGV